MDARAELGGFLKSERERRGVPLDDVAASTKIPWRSLQRLEEGKWEQLPGEVFVRGFVRAYGRELGVEGEALKRYDEARQGKARKPDRVPPPDDETAAAIQSHRRFGFALALIILLIIVTLTVSMLWTAGPRASRRAGFDGIGSDKVTLIEGES